VYRRLKILLRKIENSLAEEIRLKSKMVVQTVIVSKGGKMNRAKATTIAEKFGKADKIDETGTSWRFRQKDPGLFNPKSFRTKQVNPTTTIVLGKLK